MWILRVVVFVIVHAVTLQAQCLAFCSATACEEEHAASEAHHDAAPSPCHSNEESETSHETEARCASLPSEGERAPSPAGPVYATTASAPGASLPLLAAGRADADPPPVVSPRLRSIHVTVLLI